MRQHNKQALAYIEVIFLINNYHIEAAGAAPATINHAIDILGTALNAAYSEDKITAEMMSKKFLKDGKSAPRRLMTDEEYTAILLHRELRLH